MNIQAKRETMLLSIFRRMDDNRQEEILDLLRMIKEGYLDRKLNDLREAGAADGQERELVTLFHTFDEEGKAALMYFTRQYAKGLRKEKKQEAQNGNSADR